MLGDGKFVAERGKFRNLFSFMKYAFLSYAKCDRFMSKSSFSFFAKIILILLLFVNCGQENLQSSIQSALLQLLSENLGTTTGNSILPGKSLSLNGTRVPPLVGTVLDPSNNGTTIGIATENASVPNLILLYASNNKPFAVDANGDGILDYYLCFGGSGSVTLNTGINCSGGQVVVITTHGFDTNLDGVADNPILSDIAGDSTNPSSLISPTPGLYGGSQSVTINCSDNVAPGNIVYTTDGSVPAFSPLNGKVTNPPRASFTVGGAGDGSYTIKYRCRDFAGNIESVQTAVYQINHNIPIISITSALSSAYLSVNSGSIQSANVSWQSSQSGSYSIRLNATSCSDGTVLNSGTATANTNISSTILASQLSLGSNSVYLCVTSGLSGHSLLTITRDDTAPSITPNPGAGTYGSSPQNIQLSCNDTSSCKIAYTLDGSDPSINPVTGVISNGNLYSGSSIGLSNGSTEIRSVARDSAGNISTILSSTYAINSSVATVTVNAYIPASKAVNSNSGSTVQINWQASLSGFYKIYIGSSATCNSGTLATGTNVGGTATANVQVSSILDNSNFVNGSNTVLICVANASLDPQYGSLSTTITKDSVLPTVSSSIPANNGLGIAVSPAALTIQFSESMDATLIPASDSNLCPSTAPTTPAAITAYIYDGLGLNCTDVSAKFTWADTNKTKLVVDLSWINYPENTKVLLSFPSTYIKDLAGNAIASDVNISFTTTKEPKKFPVLKTGQASCSDANGNPIPCAGTGQDGDYTSKNTGRSYTGPTNIGAAYITTDVSTGLIWKTCALGWEVQTGTPNTCVQNTSGSLGPWPFYNDNSQTTPLLSAVNACSSLNLSNYGNISNWRLPTASELNTLPTYGSGSTPAINTTAFLSTSSGSLSTYWANYWSATSYFGDPYYSWATVFSDGSATTSVKPTSNGIFCVSSSNSHSAQISFTINKVAGVENGTVTDNVTGLTWQKCTNGLSGTSCNTGSATGSTWTTALASCNALTLAGKTWRLPNINELRSIMDYSKANPSVDTIYFPGTLSNYYWSSTSYSPSPSNAWYVHFNRGLVSPFAAKSNSYFIRCVTD
ncbi:hypothetical protein CH362_14915 [Leptospira saintgironsiae]|uniref:SbsA Ig-like domain-containing protein n=2 Tax=Leptospira saintgironsiae TaxID=2023183 RepID=A0A2M9YA96_9LEPT|nr:hypothetical protein CH362_14915 [Leptospira saintgironsiae]